MNKTEFKDKLVSINRITKVVKGGRRFAFAALVVVGDQTGSIGVGQGKSKQVPDAIKKATESAKKNLFNIDVIYTNPNKSKVYLGKEIINSGNKLKYFCTASTGINHIDIIQIKRWKNFRRHVTAIEKNCEKGNLDCRKRQRQAILQWAYNPYR